MTDLKCLTRTCVTGLHYAHVDPDSARVPRERGARRLRHSHGDAGEVSDGQDGVQIGDLTRERVQHVHEADQHQRHASLAGRRPALLPVGWRTPVIVPLQLLWFLIRLGECGVFNWFGHES